MEVRNIISKELGSNRGTIANTPPEDRIYMTDSIINANYIPFYSAFFAEYKKMGDIKYMNYFLPRLTSRGSYSTNRKSDFESAMYYYLHNIKFLKGGIEYYISKQMISLPLGTEGDRKIMYMLAVNTNYWHYAVDFEAPVYGEFLMVVHNDFLLPENKLMFNFLKKEVITPLTDVGVDIIYTSNPNRWGFNLPSIPIPQFDTLSQMREFNNNLTKEVLHGITGQG